MCGIGVVGVGVAVGVGIDEKMWEHNIYLLRWNNVMNQLLADYQLKQPELKLLPTEVRKL